MYQILCSPSGPEAIFDLNLKLVLIPTAKVRGHKNADFKMAPMKTKPPPPPSPAAFPPRPISQHHFIDILNIPHILYSQSK
jgi:hypothetical protein